MHIPKCLWLVPCVLFVAGTTHAQPIKLLSGEAADRQLQAEFQVTWQNKPLREALENLSRSQRIGIILDRRVDPGIELNVKLQGVTLEQGLHQLAAKHDLSVSFVNSLAYVGPRDTTDRVATVAMMLQDQAAALPAASRNRLQRAESVVWDRLSSPRALFEEMTDAAGLQVRGIDRIPHDVWPEMHLPPLSVVQRLALLLAGFDLTVDLRDGGTVIEIVALPDDARFTKTYQAKTGASRAAGQLRKDFPLANVTVASQRVQVDGTAAVHRAAAQLLTRSRPTGRTVTNPKRVYTFNVENKRGGDIVRYLAQQWNLTPEIDPAADPALEKLISLSVKDATQDEVLTSTLQQLGLQHTLNGKRLVVTVK